MQNVGILKLSLMVESLLEIFTTRRLQLFYKPIDLHSLTNTADEGISSISRLNTVNQLRKYDFSCD